MRRSFLEKETCCSIRLDTPKPVRVQGAFISDSEISDVVEFLKENEDVAVYDTEVTEKIESKLNSAAISPGKR